MPPENKHAMLHDCARYVGLTPSEVMSIASNAPMRYKVYEIPKRSGNGMRTVCQPARELKALQYYLMRRVLRDLDVHTAATAYNTGSSIRINAEIHKKSRVILKIDFVNFFGSIKASDWEKFSGNIFDQWTDFDIEFTKRILFWGGGGWEPNCLAIGAPSSPMLSNAFMFDFDSQMAEFSVRFDMRYSEYADDITFSSEGFIEKEIVLNKIQSALDDYRWCKLRLNESKTKLASKSFSRRVTGLVLANSGEVSLGRDRKRIISAMVHRSAHDILEVEDKARLCGLLSFANDVERPFVERLKKKYGAGLITSLMKRI